MRNFIIRSGLVALAALISAGAKTGAANIGGSPEILDKSTYHELL